MDHEIALLAKGYCQASNHIEYDEYQFIETSLERWRDRDYRPMNRWQEANDTTE